MKKRLIAISTVVGFILLAFIGASNNHTDSADLNITKPVDAVSSPEKIEKITPTCDGKTITTSCKVDDVNYSKYIYHPAVSEVSHEQTDTTYEEKVTSYCTLCNDGTYSPSCATGRGACSHHGGVAQFNAPRYSSVPVYNTKKVIDSPAQEAYYEKVIQ